MLLRKRAASADSSSNSSAQFGQGGRQLAYCLSPLLFEGIGGLRLKVPSGLTVQSVLRLTSHCSLRAHITVQEWLNAASAIGGISNETATHIFDVFFAVCSKSAEARIQLSRSILAKLGDAYSAPPSPQYVGNLQTAAASALSGRTVSLPGMMMYLICQICLEKAPRQPSGDTLLGFTEHESTIAFVKQHLHEIVSTVAVTKAGRVSMNDLTELRFLLREFLSGTEAPVGSNLTFLWPRGEQTVDCAVVSQFIRQRLGPIAEIRSAAAHYVSHNAIPSSVHIITSAPPTRSSSLFALSRCVQSSIYVLAPLPSVLLSGLSNCLVVLGPVAGVLHVERCDRCTVVALCAAVVVSESRDTDLMVCTNLPPVYSGNEGDGVRFGPYNTFYSTLEEHLVATGVNPKLNLFRVGLPPYAVIPPQGTDGLGYVATVVPATPNASNHVTTRTNPCPLPPEYAEAVHARAERFNATASLLQSAYKQLEDANRRDLADSLRSKVQHAFIDWLMASGQAKGVLDLLSTSSTNTTATAS